MNFLRQKSQQLRERLEQQRGIPEENHEHGSIPSKEDDMHDSQTSLGWIGADDIIANLPNLQLPPKPQESAADDDNRSIFSSQLSLLGFDEVIVTDPEILQLQQEIRHVRNELRDVRGAGQSTTKRRNRDESLLRHNKNGKGRELWFAIEKNKKNPLGLGEYKNTMMKRSLPCHDTSNPTILMEARILRTQHNQMIADHQMEIVQQLQQSMIDYMYTDSLPAIKQEHELAKMVGKAQVEKMRKSREEMVTTFEHCLTLQRKVISKYQLRELEHRNEDHRFDSGADTQEDQKQEKPRNSDLSQDAQARMDALQKQRDSIMERKKKREEALHNAVENIEKVEKDTMERAAKAIDEISRHTNSLDDEMEKNSMPSVGDSFGQSHAKESQIEDKDPGCEDSVSGMEGENNAGEMPGVPSMPGVPTESGVPGVSASMDLEMQPEPNLSAATDRDENNEQEQLVDRNSHDLSADLKVRDGAGVEEEEDDEEEQQTSEKLKGETKLAEDEKTKLAEDEEIPGDAQASPSRRADVARRALAKWKGRGTAASEDEETKLVEDKAIPEDTQASPSRRADVARRALAKWKGRGTAASTRAQRRHTSAGSLDLPSRRSNLLSPSSRRKALGVNAAPQASPGNSVPEENDESSKESSLKEEKKAQASATVQARRASRVTTGTAGARADLLERARSARQVSGVSATGATTIDAERSTGAATSRASLVASRVAARPGLTGTRAASSREFTSSRRSTVTRSVGNDDNKEGTDDSLARARVSLTSVRASRPSTTLSEERRAKLRNGARRAVMVNRLARSADHKKTTKEEDGPG